MSDEWIKTLADHRRVKFTNQELDERAFLTAQVEGNKVVYSIVLSNASNSLRATPSGTTCFGRQLKKQGYEVHFFFLWVKSADVALSRVRERVLKGGHDVPEAVVRRRFGRSIRNFFAEYRRLADSWYLFDNSGGTPAIVAFERAGKPRIMNPEQYQALIARYG